MENSKRSVIVDQYGELARQVSAFAPIVKQHKACADEIRSWYADSPGEAEFHVDGKLYGLDITARRVERSYKKSGLSKLLNLLGRVKFLRIAHVGMTDLDQNTTAEERLGLVEEAHTGSRTLKPVLRAAALPGKKAA